MEVMKLENTTEYFFLLRSGKLSVRLFGYLLHLWGKDIDLIGVGRTK